MRPQSPIQLQLLFDYEQVNPNFCNCSRCQYAWANMDQIETILIWSLFCPLLMLIWLLYKFWKFATIDIDLEDIQEIGHEKLLSRWNDILGYTLTIIMIHIIIALTIIGAFW